MLLHAQTHTHTHTLTSYTRIQTRIKHWTNTSSNPTFCYRNKQAKQTKFQPKHRHRGIHDHWSWATWPIGGDDNEMFIAFCMVQCIPFGFIGKSSKTFKLFRIDFVVQFNGHSIQIGYLTYRSSFSVDAGFRRIVCWLSISTTHCVLSSISVIIIFK